MKNLNFFSLVKSIITILTFSAIVIAQTNYSLTRLGEGENQELKAKELLPQPQQVPTPAKGGILKSHAVPKKSLRSVIPPGYDHTNIEVKFLDSIDVTLGPHGYPIDRSGHTLQPGSASQIFFDSTVMAGGIWNRMADGVSEEDNDRLRATAEMNLGRTIADLNNYFNLAVPDTISAEYWLDQLNSLPEVDLAVPSPLPMPPPQGNFRNRQGYLDSATNGIDASYAWTLPGGTGTNVTMCEMEYSWNLNHQDLPSIATWDRWIPAGYYAIDPYQSTREYRNHGTAVLGEMVSLNDSQGTTGSAYGARAVVVPTYATNLTGAWLYRVDAAILTAIDSLSAGDVILIEQQISGPNWNGQPQGTQIGLVPVEWNPFCYDAIVIAVGNGIHVIEAGGNGDQDLDDQSYSTWWTSNFGIRRSFAPFRSDNNSGAIIVGAGAAPATFGSLYIDRSRLSSSPYWGSNYGSRVELQGWGERVTTTGYGDLYPSTPNPPPTQVDLYTATFGGTSSASPIVTAAVALLESIYEEANPGSVLSPATVRSILVNTGSLQQGNTAQNIGPRPNLRAALGVFATVSGTVYRDDNFNCGRDSIEPGLSGWTVVLQPGSRVTTTDSNGNYSFRFVLPNSYDPSIPYYTISDVPPPGWLRPPPPPGFTLTSGESLAINFCNFEFARISGTVFLDTNRNSFLDPGESGLDNITVNLVGVNPGFDQSVLTGIDGRFEFEALYNQYTLSIAVPVGGYLTVPASGNYQINVNRSGLSFTYQDFGLSTTVVRVDEGWNMISLPINVDDPRKTIIFPTAISSAFTYEDNYVTKETLSTGVGYWLKFDSTQTIPLFGTELFTDTLNVKEGWNMIGSISNPVSVASITSIPPAIQTSDFFAYDGNTYIVTSSIDPGQGYWVRVNQNGELILDATLSSSVTSNRIKIVPTTEMPPPPPLEIGNTTLIPREYNLEYNYPNPFNPVTTLKYGLPLTSNVKLKIYNPLGQSVATLVDEIQEAGYKSVNWNSSNIASGVYFYRLEATDLSDPSKMFMQVRKMIVVK